MAVKQSLTLFSFLFGILCLAVKGQAVGKHDKCLTGDQIKLNIDTAFLTINSSVSDSIVLQEQTKECYRCGLKTVMTISSSICVTLVDTRWPMRVAITLGDGTAPTSCGEEHLSEFFRAGGNYTIYVAHRNGSVTCSSVFLQNSVTDSNIPIYVAMGIFVFAALFWIGMKRLWRSNCCRRFVFRNLGGAGGLLDPNAFTEQDLGTPTNVSVDEEEEKKPKKERLKSLDTFRGISIVVMIFVNYKGGKYWFFHHSRWNGLTVADLVFPWFVFIMGTAMAYSFQTLTRKAVPKKQIFWKIFKRSCILFFLGLLINSGGSQPVDLTQFRIPGVLQRFAGTYLIIATMHMFFARSNDPNQYNWWSGIRDVVDYWQEWIINLILVAVWLFFTFLLEVPGCPTGYLGPGGTAQLDNTTTNCTGGAAGYIDRTVFGDQHIYQSPTCKEIYDTTVPYDPEGLLGTLTSCFMCFLGLQAGKILVMFRDYKARVRRFLVWGVLLGLIATVLCKGHKNDGWIPINKNLWSLSFVLALAGMGFILLTFCYLTIDVYKIWSGAPFFYPGMNAILLYMGHEFFHNRFPVFWKIPDTHAAWLALNVWGTFLWVLVGYILYYKQVFISV